MMSSTAAMAAAPAGVAVPTQRLVPLSAAASAPGRAAGSFQETLRLLLTVVQVGDALGP